MGARHWLAWLAGWGQGFVNRWTSNLIQTPVNWVLHAKWPQSEAGKQWKGSNVTVAQDLLSKIDCDFCIHRTQIPAPTHLQWIEVQVNESIRTIIWSQVNWVSKPVQIGSLPAQRKNRNILTVNAKTHLWLALQATHPSSPKNPPVTFCASQNDAPMCARLKTKRAQVSGSSTTDNPLTCRPWAESNDWCSCENTAVLPSMSALLPLCMDSAVGADSLQLLKDPIQSELRRHASSGAVPYLPRPIIDSNWVSAW